MTISRLDFTPEQILDMKANFANKIGFQPSPGQYQVICSDKRFRILMAGSRYGKSMVGGVEPAFYTHIFSDFRVWLVGPTYDLAEKEFNWITEFISRYPMPNGGRLIDRCQISSPTRGKRRILFEWGSFIETRSTENMKSLLGEELDMIVLCEASCIPREAWERYLRARIGPRKGMLLATSTGAGDTNLFAEFVKNGLTETEEFRQWKTWQFTTLDNPVFDHEEYEQARKELAPEVFSEQYEGKLVSRRGLVFRFQNAHIAQKLPDDIDDLPIAVSIQPGYKNPCAVVFVAYRHKTREFLVIDELCFQETLTPDIVNRIREKLQGKRLLGQCVFSDVWLKDSIEEMGRYGLKIKTNDDEKKIGRQQSMISRVRAVQNILAFSEDIPLRFKIYRDCVHTIGDFQKCKWPDKPKEEADKLEAEFPLPKFFQFPQAIAHIVAFFESASGVSIYEAQRVVNRRKSYV